MQPSYEKHLRVKRSQLPGAGKGLYTTADIPKGAFIVEYKGRVSTWKEADHRNGANGYLFYYSRNFVIDALPYKKALARYANDASGLVRVKGLRNNARYEKSGGRVYIQATRKIRAGEEIFVQYGKEYWDAIRYNLKLEAAQEGSVARAKRRKAG